MSGGLAEQSQHTDFGSNKSDSEYSIKLFTNASELLKIILICFNSFCRVADRVRPQGSSAGLA